MESLDERSLLTQAHEAHQQGDSREAIELLGRVLEMNPANADARRGLAMVMFAVDDREMGAEHMRRAIADRPGRAAWHFELGRMLAELGRPEAALAEFHRAEAQDPMNPLYPGRIAMLGAHLRNHEVGRAAAQRALNLDPNEGAALLAMTKDALRRGELEEAEALALRVIGGASETIVRTSAMHEVGKIAQRRREWDKAFEAHERANKLKLAEPSAREALREPPAPFLPYLGQADAAERYRRWGGEVHDDGIPAPVVLTGFPRSGTTLAEQILAAHPGVTSCEERAVCLPVRRELDGMMAGEMGLRPLLQVLDELSEEQVRSLRATYRREVERHVPPEERSLVLIDKHPMRILDLGLMNRLFPESRVIFMVRDPRDVCVSAFFQDFALTPDMVRCLSLSMCAEWYAKVMGFWLKLRPKLSLNVLEVRYEDLVVDFDTWARRMLEFVGVGWDERVREYHKPAAERLVRSASSEAVTEKLNTRAIGRWKRYGARLAPVLDTLEPFVDAFGYEPSDGAPEG